MKNKNRIKSVLILLITAGAALLLLAGCGKKSASNNDVYLTFKLSDKVTFEKVEYKNRFGITIAGHLYTAKDIDKSKKYPAILIGSPYGGVKEQGPGVYANEMAQRGFVVLTFDESYNGESGGDPKDVSSPGIFVEDFSAGVDFLGTRPFVDREKIGVIGICGSGAFSLTAAQVDRRIKAVATASMYDMSRATRYGFMDSLSEEGRNKMLDQLGQQRWNDFENGTPALPKFSFPNEPQDKVPDGLNPVAAEFFEYYGMKRGWHPNTIPNFTLTSAMDFMNFPLLSYVKSISPRPILFIMGENAHSRYFTEDVYKQAAEPKELLIIPGARHIDLYDHTDMIPFEKLESFFKENLK